MPCPNSARKRSKTIAFRVSPEEYERITNLAKLSGMDKQDFIMAKLMDHEIVVRPSTRVHKALKGTMAEIYQQLLRIRAGGEISASIEETLLIQAVRLAPGADISAKILNITQGFSAAFENALPSVYPLDLLVGIVGAVIIRLIVYVKGKNAKKYRKGAEYGSAR